MNISIGCIRKQKRDQYISYEDHMGLKNASHAAVSILCDSGQFGGLTLMKQNVWCRDINNIVIA